MKSQEGIINGKRLENKDYSISFARFVSMCFIVACHIMQRDGFASNIGSAHIQWAFWFNVGVQMFLFISGLLYGKKEKIDTVEFYKKNFPKILVDYYVFVFSMLLLIYWSPLMSINRIGIERLLTFSGTVPGLGHLWFIPTILFCYLFTPIISEIINIIDKRSNVRFVVESFLLLLLVHELVSYFFRSFTPAWINCFILGMIYSKIECKKSIDKYFKYLFVVLCLFFIPIQFRIDYWPHGDLPAFFASRYRHFVQYGHVYLGIVLVVFIRYIYNKLSLYLHSYYTLNYSDKYSYDIYLVHHVFVQSAFCCVNFISNRWVAIPLAIVLIILSAMLLYRVSNFVHNMCASVYRKLPN